MVFYNSYLFGAILSLGTIQLPATGWQNIVTTTSYNSSSNKTHKPATSWKNVITVTATAYNSLPGQTDSTPDIAAWGDKLKPGMKSIAVSRDLLAMGLKHRTKVKIEGLEGTYVVLDKMNKRWKKKIDIYMGEDAKAARNWGRHKIKISW